MTPQEVMRAFVQKLASHGLEPTSGKSTSDYKYGDKTLGEAMLDEAVRTSTKFTSIQQAIDSFLADQQAAEREAIKEIFGDKYQASAQLSDISAEDLNMDSKTLETTKVSNAYLNEKKDNRTTISQIIKERTAYIFLEKYCGIKLFEKWWFTSDSGSKTSYSSDSGNSGNTDTGAITGADANITLTAGVDDVTVDGAVKKLSVDDVASLKDRYGTDAAVSGSTIVIGSGKNKTDQTVVPEYGNKYVAATSVGQIINTGSNDWIVEATNLLEVPTSLTLKKERTLSLSTLTTLLSRPARAATR